MSEINYIANQVSYIVYEDSGTYYAKDGATGKVTSNATLNTLLTSITTILGVNGGTVFLKEISFDYSFTIPEKILLIESYQGKIRNFINSADTQGSPYTVSTDDTYYFVQDKDNPEIERVYFKNSIPSYLKDVEEATK